MVHGDEKKTLLLDITYGFIEKKKKKTNKQNQLFKETEKEMRQNLKGKERQLRIREERERETIKSQIGNEP